MSPSLATPRLIGKPFACFRDKYLTAKYRFRSLANCEVWQEHLRPGIDSLANLSPVLRMLDTYVKFNRLESRAAAIEELLHGGYMMLD